MTISPDALEQALGELSDNMVFPRENALASEVVGRLGAQPHTRRHRHRWSSPLPPL